MRLFLSSTLLLALPGVLFGSLPAQGGGGGGGGSTTTTPPANATVAFRADYRLTLARADASGQTGIGTLPLDWAPMAWAPNGGSIYFQDDAGTGVYKIRPDGTGQSLVVPFTTNGYTGVGVTRGQPCPDGQHRIFFPVGANDEELWSARLDGSDVRNHGVGYWFEPNFAGSLQHPSVSTSGDKVLVVAGTNDLVLISLGLVGGQLEITGRQSLIYDDPSHPLHGGTIWTAWLEAVSPNNPNGTKVVCVVNMTWPSGPDRIYRLDISQPGQVQQLPIPQTRIVGLTASDDGNCLYYGAPNTRSGYSIFRANWSGTGAVDWSLAAKRKNHVWPCVKP